VAECQRDVTVRPSDGELESARVQPSEPEIVAEEIVEGRVGHPVQGSG